MSPEIILHEKYSEKADVFSFGMILYEIATHIIPFSGIIFSFNFIIVGMLPKNPDISDYLKICDAIQQGNRPSFTQQNEYFKISYFYCLYSWPSSWSDLFTKCWRQNAIDRPDFSYISTQLATILQGFVEVSQEQSVIEEIEYLNALKYYCLIVFKNKNYYNN